MASEEATKRGLRCNIHKDMHVARDLDSFNFILDSILLGKHHRLHSDLVASVLT